MSLGLNVLEDLGNMELLSPRVLQLSYDYVLILGDAIRGMKNEK